MEAAGGDAAAALAEDVTGHDGDAAEDGAAGQDGSSAGGESPTLRARAAGDSRRAGRRVTDTMAAELAGWAAGELPGQAAARLASWAAVGGLTGRGSAEADLRSGGSAAESVM